MAQWLKTGPEGHRPIGFLVSPTAVNSLYPIALLSQFMKHWSAFTVPCLGLALALASPSLAAAADPLPSGLLELTQGNSTYRADLLRFSEEQSWLVDGIETLFTDL